MRAIVLLHLLITFVATSNGQQNFMPQQQGQPMQTLSSGQSPAMFQTSPNIQSMPQNGPSNGLGFQSTVQIPFPQCLTTDKASTILTPKTLQNLFVDRLVEEDRKLKQERARNNDLNNNDIMDFDAVQLRADTFNGALVARTATKVTEDIIALLGCVTNATITQQIDDILRRIRLPSEVCAFTSNVKCDGLTQFRTITGVCNNLQRPYEGSSQTAYARLLPAAYDDGISAPRSQSVLGGPLPGCRDISLALGSKPIFDKSFNNLFVAYGQFLVHDITLATPVTDSGRTPITSCSCNSRDTNMCTVIDITASDPFLSGQKCMALPASAQAFSDQICSLGVKDQMNGNSHYIDLSVTYGSTRQTAIALRTGTGGQLKSATRPWSRFELPPGQRVPKSCVDSTPDQPCFAGGDSRLMDNILLSGLQAQWLRLHNIFAKELARIRPDWRNDDNRLYDEAKKILSALHQRYAYEDWLPILIGPQTAQRFLGNSGAVTQYSPSTPGVVFNEAVSAVLRLHTLVRDLYSRCTRGAQLIDQVWLHDITSKAKLAYDAKNNGVDSFLCGSLFDFGFAGDSNFAQQIHHRFMETTNAQGETRRNDLISINICRAREHGIPGYNAYRELCGLKRANNFQDFADTMSMEAVQKLQMIYKHPDDVDLFVGVNNENHLPDALVGPVSACIIGTQFQNLKYGDRFFYSHQGEFTPEQFKSIEKYSYQCFICHSTDIDQVTLHPFRPPNDQTNPAGLCSQCPIFDFGPWRLDTRRVN